MRAMATGPRTRLHSAWRALTGRQDESQHDLIHTLNEVADAVSSAIRVEDVLETIVARAKMITDTDKAVLLLADEHSHRLDVDTIVVRGRRAQHAQEWWEAQLDDLGDIVFSTGQPVIEMHPEHGAAMLASPLLVRDRPIGLLCAINSIERPFQPEHLDFAQILCAFAASAIENARLAEQGHYVLLASERDRIAREMHDGVVQSIFSVTLGLEVCKKKVVRDPSGTAVVLDELQERLNVAMTELRRVIYDLRPMKLTELGLVEAIEYWIREITMGRPVKGVLHVEGPLPTLNPAQEACLYRVAKEAVSNVVRHAGAGSFRVCIEKVGTWVRLTVADDGIGFDAALALGGGTQGLGLKSISDRATRDGGRLRVESVAGRGTVLTVEIPLEGAK